jgi:hypothetical protein
VVLSWGVVDLLVVALEEERQVGLFFDGGVVNRPHLGCLRVPSTAWSSLALPKGVDICLIWQSCIVTRCPQEE